MSGRVENLKPMKPGETLNPNGRPKGSRSMTTILREMLELVIDTPKSEISAQWTDKPKIKLKDALVLKEIVEAIKGNENAKKRVWEYMVGKPNQNLNAEIKQINSLPEGLTKEELLKLADADK